MNQKISIPNDDARDRIDISPFTLGSSLQIWLNRLRLRSHSNVMVSHVAKCKPTKQRAKPNSCLTKQLF
uniref:Uncharacterized protein n=1 Tax=Anguilla anguilla TaxID=7936 RepID=A0A0E9TM88_ANGAN